MSLLAVEGLAKRFGVGTGAVEALRGISFAVAAGETVAITGASGSGKSTLLGLLAGLERPSAGTVRFAGDDLAGLDEEALARLRGRRLGIVFQSFRLLPTFTAEENVRVPLELAGCADAAGRAREWLARVGLADRASHLPSRLSGGEQQRVAIARALAPGPDLVLADEPTGNLDSATGAAMGDLLFALAAETRSTLLVVTHEEPLATRAARRLVLADGRIVDDRRPR